MSTTAATSVDDSLPEEEPSHQEDGDPAADDDRKEAEGESSHEEEQEEDVGDQYEFPPDNLDDFVVLDEAEMSEAEDELDDVSVEEEEREDAEMNYVGANGDDGVEELETGAEEIMSDEENIEESDDEGEGDDKEEPPGTTEKAKKPTAGAQQPTIWECPPQWRAPRAYTKSDLSPTEPDPRCKPNWPLAAYWPVYVGNFKINPIWRFSEGYCAKAVHNFFCFKGLPSFMVVHLKDSFHETYQKQQGLFDMLVYFCCKQDAFNAIKWCHRAVYYGHRLNVYDGRSPKFFGIGKAFRFNHRQEPDQNAMETDIEQYVSQYRAVECVSKIDLEGAYVQFKRKLSQFHANGLADITRFRSIAVLGPVRRQRFLEEDVEQEILHQIDSNPLFMQAKPTSRNLKSLMRGVIPKVDMKWAKNPDILPVKKLKMFKDHPQHHEWIDPHPQHPTPLYRPVVEPRRQEDLAREAAALSAQLDHVRQQMYETEYNEALRLEEHYSTRYHHPESSEYDLSETIGTTSCSSSITAPIAVTSYYPPSMPSSSSSLSYDAIQLPPGRPIPTVTAGTHVRKVRAMRGKTQKKKMEMRALYYQQHSSGMFYP